MINSLICCVMFVGASAPDESFSEDATVVQAARTFRIDSYERYRLNREVYDARVAVADQLLKDWTSTAHSTSHRNLVVRWLQAATQTEGANLPPTPYLPFGKDVKDEFATFSNASAETEDYSNPFIISSTTSDQPTEANKTHTGVVGCIGRALLSSVRFDKE